MSNSQTTADHRRNRAMDALQAMPFAHPAQSEAIAQLRADAVYVARLRDLLRKASDALEDLLQIPDTEYNQLCRDIKEVLNDG